jgi:hypothetical protein
LSLDRAAAAEQPAEDPSKAGRSGVDAGLGHLAVGRQHVDHLGQEGGEQGQQLRHVET